MSFFQKKEEEKFEIIYNFFNELENTKKHEKITNRGKCILFLTKKYRDNLYLCKLASERVREKFEPTEDDIKSSLEANYPYIYVVFDLKRQLILVQHKSSVFREVKTAVDKIKGIFIPIAKDSGYNFTIDPVSFESSFWDYVRNVQKIYEVVLSLKAPNLFGGIFSTNSFLKEIKKRYNSTETEIKYKNEDGNLNIEREEFEDPIRYASAGGGQWRIKIQSGKTFKRVTIKSNDNIKKIEISEISMETEEALFQLEQKIKENDPLKGE
ncbi:hypothetical protein Q2T46_02800 [Thermoanaerobacterium sp. CMT5567-10]|uniref:hypothetical protein n=1 Tax=Thermoanaerobacterium sp. CMT5567-10 TaxID=3061989 RepID=UPI0026E01B2C|nr:hypothetical protein [Thermoanaerobacterium sp. CMT5567-10]WKV09404.1 hypothetical protein Q2T46_02800 [Thermoanaerobacterium sp. CMT5567-10]